MCSVHVDSNGQLNSARRAFWFVFYFDTYDMLISILNFRLPLQAVKPRLLARRFVSLSDRSISKHVEHLSRNEVKVVCHPGEEPTKSATIESLMDHSFCELEVCDAVMGLSPNGPILTQLQRSFPQLVTTCEVGVRFAGGVFRSVLGYSDVKVKLEIVRGTRCPRFHMDFVPLRAICTFAGPGTVYLPTGAFCIDGDSVSEVVESAAEVACTGDWVFLKGRHWPGAKGLGAVHRSPHVGPDDLRLVVTVDASK